MVNPFKTLVAITPLISLLIIGIATGLRGRFIWVVSLVVVAGLFYGRGKIIALSFLIVVLVFPVFSVLGDGNTRNAMASSSSLGEVFSLVLDSAENNILNSGDMVEGVMHAYSWRAQGVRNSVALYDDYDNGGGGFKAYYGAILAFVPRSLWNEKPLPGSLSNAESDGAMYKVMSIGYGDEISMGPQLASANAYWEGGWIWVVFAGLLSGIFWSWVFNLAKKMPDIFAATFTLSFCASQLVDGLLTMLCPLYSFIVTFWFSLLPLFLIIIGIRIVTNGRSRRGTSRV